jgi:hypothetical protein
MLQGVESAVGYLRYVPSDMKCPFAPFTLAVCSEMEWTDADSFTELCRIPVVACFLPKLLYETWIDKQPYFVTLRLRHVTHDDAMRFDSSLSSSWRSLGFPTNFASLLKDVPICITPKSSLLFHPLFRHVSGYVACTLSCREFLREMLFVNANTLQLSFFLLFLPLSLPLLNLFFHGFDILSFHANLIPESYLQNLNLLQ